MQQYEEYYRIFDKFCAHGIISCIAAFPESVAVQGFARNTAALRPDFPAIFFQKTDRSVYFRENGPTR